MLSLKSRRGAQINSNLVENSRPKGQISVAYHRRIPQDPSHTIVGMLIEYPPNGSSPPHRHGGASVQAVVISGEVLMGMNDQEAKVFKAGEAFFEEPGCHHRVSDNNSKAEPCVFLATLIIKTEILEKEGFEVLVQIDEQYKKDMLEQPER